MLKIERLHAAPGVSLNPVQLSDAAPLASLISANLATLALHMPQVAALAHPHAAREHLEHALAAAAEHTLYEWHIVADGVLCGSIRLNHIEPANHKASVGYFVSTSHQGRGLATQSVRTVAQWCFEELGLNRIELRCTSDNLASQSVAKRVGFVWEGMLRQAELLNGVFVDYFVYGLLKEEFHPRTELDQAA